MKSSIKQSLMAVVLAGAGIGAAHAEPTRVVSAPAMENLIAVEILAVDGSVIKGRLTNRSGNRIEAPELMAKYDWLWHDDHHPGPNDPGWVTYTVLPTELAANESTEFTIDPKRPLPARDDGQIMTSVAVTRVTAFKQPDSE